MQIFFRSFLSGAEHRYRFEYELAGEPNYCCPAMVQLWGEVVVFGFGGLPPRESNLRAYCTFNCFEAEGAVSVEDVGITHCPWCGREIKLVPVGDAGNPAMLAVGSPTDDSNMEGGPDEDGREKWKP